jgi:hypothetical protein
MFLETQKNKNRFREIKEQKSPHSVPKGKGKITALCAKGQGKNHRTLCQRALWDLSKGKIFLEK